MKLLNYINEAVVVDMDTVMDNCKQYIKYIDDSKKLFYRGSQHNYNLGVTKVKPRKDRRPKTSSIKFHDYCDRFFERKFGWRARSEGVFAKTGTIMPTYGTAYIFFPADNFEYLWSPYVSDLFRFEYLINQPELVLHEKKPYIVDPFPGTNAKTLEIKPGTNYKGVLDAILNTYINDDLQSAMKAELEVMFKCTNYYMVNMSDKKVRDIIKQGVK